MIRILRTRNVIEDIISGRSSVGRATAFQAVGRRFEPGRPLKSLGNQGLWALLVQYAELKEFSYLPM